VNSSQRFGFAHAPDSRRLAAIRAQAQLPLLGRSSP
jgi:hypothetical protein